jgi:hypothetical protein
MLGSGVPLDRYLVFCKLLRAGYIVQRHPARWVLGPREDLAQAWAGWGQKQQSQQQQELRSGGAAAAAAAPQPVSAGGSAAQASAPPTGPAAKRRKVDPQQQQRCSGAWWPAGTAAEGQQEGSSTASASPWLSCLPPGFMDSLPRCTVLPDAAQRARSDFPRMAPLPGIPLADLQPLVGPEGGRHLLVSCFVGCPQILLQISLLSSQRTQPANCSTTPQSLPNAALIAARPGPLLLCSITTCSTATAS